MDEELTRRHAEILLQLGSLISKVDQNITELKLLRLELGLDSMHGRIPLLETTMSRHELRMDKMDTTVEKLKETEAEEQGRAKLLTGVIALLGGGVAGALIEVAAHMFMN